MRPLRPGKGRRLWVWLVLAGRADLDVHALVAHELHAGVAVLSATPVSPQQGSGSSLEGMHQHADPTWLFRVPTMPLTLLAQPTGTTISNLGGVEYPQRAIGFAALFGRAQRLARGAVERAVSLRSKVAPREASGFPGQASLGSSVAKGAIGALRRLWNGWSPPRCCAWEKA